MEIKLDKHKLKCKIKCDWAVDFTYPNSLARVFGFEKRLLKPSITHFSDHMPEIYGTYLLKKFIAVLLAQILKMTIEI